jgi:hypothetical protein
MEKTEILSGAAAVYFPLFCHPTVFRCVIFSHSISSLARFSTTQHFKWFSLNSSPLASFLLAFFVVYSSFSIEGTKEQKAPTEAKVVLLLFYDRAK